MKRDYDQEHIDGERRYAYSFDFDVMHPFMLRAFQPFIVPGPMLELGCFKGDFSLRLLELGDDLTCVEASEEALKIAANRLGKRAILVQGRFEDVQLERRYTTVFLTHVLEHLDQPVDTLRRIREKWLAPGGRLLVACPNAQAPSRQIAVQMGLISHASAVTEAEKAHGHRITYSLDTLESDVRNAGWNVLHRGGIFFKALANFQWDKAIAEGIVSSEYLEGCYRFGQYHPSLCASIFCACDG